MTFREQLMYRFSSPLSCIFEGKYELLQRSARLAFLHGEEKAGGIYGIARCKCMSASVSLLFN